MPTLRRSTLLPTLALLLAACGQGGTPAAAPPPQTPHTGPTVPGTADVKLLSASATSNTSFHLVFDGVLGAGSDDARSYTLADASGASLEVLAAYVSADGRSVDLATRAQDARPYTLVLSGVLSRSGQAVLARTTVTGSLSPAPVLSDVVPLSATEVLLSFGDPVSGRFAALDDSAAQAAAYRLSPAAEIRGVRLSQDRSSVVVTTGPLSAGSYTVAALSVRTAPGGGTGVLIDPQHNQATFSPQAAQDTVKPVIRRMVAPSSTSVQLIFSEPLGTGAADVGNYLIRDAAGAVLAVTGATLNEFRTVVTLTTSPQAAASAYTLTPSELRDVAGNPLETAGGASMLIFRGYSGQDSGQIDVTPPRVAGAVSRSNSTVLVTFSEAVRGGSASAENPSHYRITGLEQLAVQGQTSPSATVTPQSAALDILSAVLQPGGTSVLLTTRAQSDIRYEVQVTGVTDLAGNQIAPPERGVDPGKATFVGTPVSGGGTDTDSDGLTDAAEQRGWLVNVTRLDGTSRRYEVTSDPTLKDTDADGLEDVDELANLTDPRAADTDGDKITDSDEYNVVYSSPIDADTDKDTLADGAEYTFFASSPLLADSDGDQIRDDAEVLTSLRNPLIADMPSPRIRVEGVNLQLDVNFKATSETGTRTLDSKTAQTTLTQSTSESQERSDTTTSEWFANQSIGASFTQSIGASYDNFAQFSYTISGSSDTGVSGSAATNFTSASVRAAQQEYANSLTTDKEVTVNDSVTREVVGAAMSVGVTVESVSTVSFTMNNLELTAFMPDPFAPGKLIPVATLRPEGAIASNGITLGPGTPARGPIRFTAVQVYPALVSELLQNPEGLVFKISNYNVTDESRRDLAYVNQGLKERTAEFFIDYGGALPFERSNVATFSSYGPDGRPTGIPMRRIMEDILRLKHYDKAQDAGLSPQDLHNSYSTFMHNGIEKLARVREKTFGSLNDPKRWFVTVNNNGSRVGFRDTLIQSGDKIRLAYNEDNDNDGLTRAEEDLYGSSDLKADTDGDRVPDIEEVYGPANATGRRTPRTVLGEDGNAVALISNPGASDTDGDGLSDCQELLILDGSTRVNGMDIPLYRCPMAVQARTLIYASPLDPSNPDTDADGLSDRTELFGYTVKSYIPTGLELTVYSDPRKADTDNDQTPDKLEYRLGTNPSVADRALVLDEDRDGLSNYQETQGWRVQALLPSGSVDRVVTSNPVASDADRDALNDAQEKLAGTDPNDADTDKDGLPDGAEVTLGTKPTNWDTDTDQLGDGTEVNSDKLVVVKNQAPYKALFNPLARDADGDQLGDNLEYAGGTDPNLRDTDKDGSDDYFEVVTSVTINHKTDALMKDKLLLLKIDSADIIGDCDSTAGDNYGNFVGEILTQSGTTTPKHVLYINGLLDNTPEGGRVYFDNTQVWMYVTEERALRVYSVGMKEVDGAGIPDDELNEFDKTYPYAEVNTGNYSIDATGADASKANCKLTFNYSFTLRQN